MGITQINGLSNAPAQFFSVDLEDGTNANFSLRYCSEMLQWFLDVSYKNFTYNTVLTLSTDLLKRMRYRFPFSVLCLSNDNDGPYFLDDFVGDATNDTHIRIFVATGEDIEALPAIVQEVEANAR